MLQNNYIYKFFSSLFWSGTLIQWLIKNRSNINFFTFENLIIKVNNTTKLYLLKINHIFLYNYIIIDYIIIYYYTII